MEKTTSSNKSKSVIEMIDPVKKSTDLSIPHITEWKITCKPTDAKDFIQV